MAGPSAAERRAQSAVARRLGEAGYALPGTLTERAMRCGKANCGCKADPPRLHGPYHQWTRKVDGKTVTVTLTDDQVARYGPWFANARALRAALNEIEQLSLRIAQRDEGWK